MCTSIAFSQYALYGRNLDLECGFGEQVAIAPRNQVFSFHSRECPLFSRGGRAAVESRAL